MRAYIEVNRVEKVVSNRFNTTTKKVIGELSGKGNRRLVNVLASNGVAVPTWIDAPGFKVECTFEDGTKGILDARFLNILEAPKAAVEVVGQK